jgi:MauM/NapG family ferredoxin protein
METTLESDRLRMTCSRREIITGSVGFAGTVLGGGILQALAWRAQPLLRPPGAGSEEDFLAACVRCGQCVTACPNGVLQLAGGSRLGTPYLMPREVPCNLCAGLDTMRCIDACPTAALVRSADRRAVRMGTAVVDPSTCLPFQGVVCRACWHACPFPQEAITMDDRGRPVVLADACIGCGLCEYACPTEPSSIVVEPRGFAPPIAKAPKGASR